MGSDFSLSKSIRQNRKTEGEMGRRGEDVKEEREIKKNLSCLGVRE